MIGHAGNDTFVWSPGDGNDRIEGSSESDTLLVRGSVASETVELSANGSRLWLRRYVTNILMDVADVERVTFEARGASDLIVVNTGSGTGVQQITIDLEGVADTNTPDGRTRLLFSGEQATTRLPLPAPETRSTSPAPAPRSRSAIPRRLSTLFPSMAWKATTGSQRRIWQPAWCG